MRAERQRLQQESELLARTNGELAAAIAQARRESTAASAELRTALVLLQHDVDRLRMAEQDLTVARRRGAEIEQALTPLRALEVALREQEQLRAEATRKIAALQAEAATKEAEVAAVTAELQPRVQALAARLAALKQLGVTLANAEAAIEQALKGVTPAPAETKK